MIGVQSFLQILKGLDERYLANMAPYWSGSEFLHTGSIYRSEATYEDLFYLAEQIRLVGVGLADDAPVASFVDAAEQAAGAMLRGTTKVERQIELYHLAAQATDFIQWLVADSLEAGRAEGLDLLIELAKSQRNERLDIVTLNHDLLVESLFSEHGIAYVDGFGDAQGEVRYYDGSAFDSGGGIWLLKPHGSIDWFQITVQGRQRYARIERRGVGTPTGGEGETARNRSRLPSFLSGKSKVLAYNKGIFVDTFYRFQQALHENCLMVMSGYGWGDTAINMRLAQWLDRDRSHRLILLHRNPEALRRRSLEMDESYGAWLKAGQLIPVTSWLCDATLRSLQGILD